MKKQIDSRKAKKKTKTRPKEIEDAIKQLEQIQEHALENPSLSKRYSDGIEACIDVLERGHPRKVLRHQRDCRDIMVLNRQNNTRERIPRFRRTKKCQTK